MSNELKPPTLQESLTDSYSKFLHEYGDELTHRKMYKKELLERKAREFERLFNEK